MRVLEHYRDITFNLSFFNVWLQRHYRSNVFSNQELRKHRTSNVIHTVGLQINYMSISIWIWRKQLSAGVAYLMLEVTRKLIPHHSCNEALQYQPHWQCHSSEKQHRNVLHTL